MKVFTVKFISIGVVLPLLLLLGIQQSQYYLLEVPQQAVVRHIESETLKKNPQKVLEHKKQRDEWQRTHLGQPAGDGVITKLMDVSTPRIPTIVENFFGESIQLHQRSFLKDVSWERPIFVEYNWSVNYIIEAFIVLLFIVGIVFSYKQRFFKMLLAWFACDLTLHLILGFAVTEVYINDLRMGIHHPHLLRLLTETIIDEMAKSDACDVNHANHLPFGFTMQDRHSIT